jgi:hypothetical protein
MQTVFGQWRSLLALLGDFGNLEAKALLPYTDHFPVVVYWIKTSIPVFT